MSTKEKEDYARRYQCACGYGTDVKRCFVEHRRTHTDERPYVCECGARFRRSNHLAAHQKRKIITIDQNNQKVLQCRPVKKRAKPTNPNGRGNRPWKCDCGSTFKWNHLLISHKRGYSCPHRAASRTRSPPKEHGIMGANILHERNIEINLPGISSIAPVSPRLGGVSGLGPPQAGIPLWERQREMIGRLTPPPVMPPQARITPPVGPVLPGSTVPSPGPFMAQPVPAYPTQYIYGTVPAIQCAPSALQPVPSLPPVSLTPVPHMQSGPEPWRAGPHPSAVPWIQPFNPYK